MDPLSIAASTVGIASFCGQIVISISQLVEGYKSTDSTIQDFSDDLKGLAHVLDSITAVLQDPNGARKLETDGIEGQHWRNVQRCLGDCRGTLDRLDAIVTGLKITNNKILGRARTQMKLSIKAGEMALLRRQLQSCRQTMQISLQMILVTSQLSDNDAANRLMPRLDEVTQDVRTVLDALRNMSLGGYQFLDSRAIPQSAPTLIGTQSQNTSSGGINGAEQACNATIQHGGINEAEEAPAPISPETLATDDSVLRNLTECALSAGRLASSASSRLTGSVSCIDSTFGDFLAADRWESIEVWIPTTASDPTTGSSGANSGAPAAGLTSTSSAPDNTQHVDLEHQLMEKLFAMGCEAFESGDYVKAEQCMRRLSNFRQGDSNSVFTHSDESVDILIASYCKQEKWQEAEHTLLERMGDCHLENEQESMLGHRLAEVLFRSGRLDEAETWCKATVTARDKFLGKTHPHFLQSVELLIAIYQKKQDYVVAECYMTSFLPSGCVRGGLFWQEAVAALKRNGFDLERMQQNDVANAVRWASEQGLDKVLTVLIETKGGIRDVVNRADQIGKTPLHYAAMYGHATAAKILLENGADTEITAACTMRSLHLAAAYGETAAGQVLLDYGADVDAVTYDKKTPLHTATEENKPEFMKLLLSRNAQIEARTNRLRTPLHQACSRGHLEALTLLLLNRASLAVTDIEGYSPLSFATARGDSSTVQVLLEHGANTEAASLSGATPLFPAVAYGHFDVVERLLGNGASANAADKRGTKPLNLAKAGGHKQIAELLLRYGATAGKPPKGR